MPAGQVLDLVQKEILAARRGFDFEIGLVEGLEIRGLEFGETIVFKIDALVKSQNSPFFGL